MPDILRLDVHTLSYRLQTRPHAGCSVHIHQTVGAIAGSAQQTAWSVILKAATKNASASSVQRGCNRITGLGRNRFTSESERYCFVVINDLNRVGGESNRAHRDGIRVERRGEAFMY